MSRRPAMTASDSDTESDHMLIYWPEKHSVSIVREKDLVIPSVPEVNDVCMVREGETSYYAVIAAIGSQSTLTEIEDKFMAGHTEGMTFLQVFPRKPITDQNTAPTAKRMKMSLTSQGEQNQSPAKNDAAKKHSKRITHFKKHTKRTLYESKRRAVLPHSSSGSTIVQIAASNSGQSSLGVSTTQPNNNPLQDSTNTVTGDSDQNMSRPTRNGEGSQGTCNSNSDLLKMMEMMDTKVEATRRETFCLHERVKCLEAYVLQWIPYLPLAQPQTLLTVPTVHLPNHATLHPSNPTNQQPPNATTVRPPITTTVRPPTTMTLRPPTTMTVRPPITMTRQPTTSVTQQAVQQSTSATRPEVKPPTPSIPSPKIWPLTVPQALNEYTGELPTLAPLADVLVKYWNLTSSESKMGVLAVKLARECFFGDDVMAKCTPTGWHSRPALPNAALNEIKQAVFSAFCRFCSKPETFEKKWVIAQEAIAQCCKRLRKKTGS